MHSAVSYMHLKKGMPQPHQRRTEYLHASNVLCPQDWTMHMHGLHSSMQQHACGMLVS